MGNISDKTDQGLLQDFSQYGQEADFAELVRRHHASAFAAAYRICGDRTEAQDILQQALIVLARRAGELTRVTCLSAWLHRVVILEARKAQRKSYNRRKRETMAYQIQESSTIGPDALPPIFPEMDMTLNAMSEKDRVVITLHYLENQTFKSIAARLGGNAEAWQKRSIRALQKLADQLKRRGMAVSAVALGAYLTSTRMEAGISPAFLETITRHALEAGSRNAVATAGKAALLLTMKTGIAISLTSGIILAYGWNVAEHVPALFPWTDSSSIASPISPNDAIGIRGNRQQGFTMEMVKTAIAEYDGAEKPEALSESRLRSLMFLVPQKNMEEVLQLLLETKDHARFQDVAGALFGCWAEYDPAAALVHAGNAEDFSYQAKRAVMLTWLNQDAESALAVILEDKSVENRGFLAEFLTYQCEGKPESAAGLVDRVALDWPEADDTLFTLVARLWSRTDGLAAGAWVATCSDEALKNKLLKSMAMDVAKLRGFDGLAIANHIENEKARLEARNTAIYWWGITTAGPSLIPGQSGPVGDLSNGFPPDWTHENIRTFSQAAMVNYSNNLGDLLKIAQTDEQRIRIYEGAIKGSGWSNPGAVTAAAEQLPDSFAETAPGKETLKVFIRRWHEMDAHGAESWLSKQTPGPKSQVMREELNREGNK